MKKKIALTVSFLVAALAAGFLGFFLGTQAATGYWLHQYLRQVAYDVWILERAKSSIEETASQDEIEWFDREIRNAERALDHQEYLKFVESDQHIQRLKERISTIRGDRGIP